MVDFKTAVFTQKCFYPDETITAFLLQIFSVNKEVYQSYLWHRKFFILKLYCFRTYMLASGKLMHLIKHNIQGNLTRVQFVTSWNISNYLIFYFNRWYSLQSMSFLYPSPKFKTSPKPSFRNKWNEYIVRCIQSEMGISRTWFSQFIPLWLRTKIFQKTMSYSTWKRMFRISESSILRWGRWTL